MKKKVIILFGEMGAGKNYHGERLAYSEGLTFLDGDNCVSGRMLAKVVKFKPIPRDILLDYIDNHLTPQIIEHAYKSRNGIVVAQALYLDNDRHVIMQTLEAHGFDVEFYWVKTPRIRNIKQLYSRKNGTRWVLYYLQNTAFFQKPTHPHKLIVDNVITGTIH